MISTVSALAPTDRGVRYSGRNRFEAGKPRGVSLPALARRPSQSRQSVQARLRPSAVVQDAPSPASNNRPSRRPLRSPVSAISCWSA